MHTPPRYTFGNVNGIMKDGTSIAVGVQEDSVTVTFDYHDRETGKMYHVVAKGFRAEVPKKEDS